MTFQFSFFKTNVIHPRISQKEKLVRINKYLREIKPLLMILRGFGRFPFIFDDGRVVFRPLTWPVWYTVFIVVFQVLGTYYIMQTILFQIANRGNFDDSLYGLALAISLFQSLAIPITYWWESSRLLSYINDWYYFQEEFGRDNLDFASTGLIKTLCIIHIPVLISMLVGIAYIFKDFRFIIFSPCVTALGSISATLLFWCVTLYELRTASDKLMTMIIESDCRNMYQYRILWQKLSKLTTSLGESAGHTGVAVCFLIFTTFVLSTYGFLSLAIDRSFSKSFVAFLSMSLFCMALQFIMCDAAHKTTQTVGEKFSNKLLQITTSSLSQRDQFEMKFLLQTMMTNPPVIHFLGYLIVDRHLFVKFISDTVTYLVVLIQFKTSSYTRTLVNA